MELLLVRHAKPEATSDSSEEPDPPLSRTGVSEVERLVNYLDSVKIGAVYTSPLLRARQTAEPISAAFATDTVPVEDLRELNLGGKNYTPAEELGPNSAEIIRKIREPIEGGGGNPLVTDFRHRTLTALDRIGKVEADGAIVVVCHLGVINAAVTAILGIFNLVAFELEYTSVTKIEVSDTGRRAVCSIKESQHLQKHSR